MPDYGRCAQCAREIDSQTGYSNRRGERICIPCQFSRAAPNENAASTQTTAGRKFSLRLGLGAGALGRIGISISEFHRRCTVANEAHATETAAHESRQPARDAPINSLPR
jgi:hypothetical protein